MVSTRSNCLLAVALVSLVAVGCGSSETTAAPSAASPSAVPASVAPTTAVAAPSQVAAVPTATPAPADAPSASPPPSPTPRSILDNAHPKVAVSAVATAVKAAVAGPGDPASPGLAKAMPGLLKECQAPTHRYAMDHGYGCLFLTIAAYHAYLDTGDDAWYDASLAALNYTWNAKFTTTAKGYKGLLAPDLMAGSGTASEFMQTVLRDQATTLLRPQALGGPVADRKSLLSGSHPRTTISTVGARLNAALAAEPTPDASELKTALRDCKAKVRGPADRDAAETAQYGCTTLAMTAYRIYLETGSERWYRAARATADYIWRHNYLTPGWGSSHLEPEALRYNLRESLRSMLLYDAPGYIGQAP